MSNTALNNTHKNYRLKTHNGSYFIKQLNPYYLKKYGLQQFIRAETMAKFWYSQDVPVVYALQKIKLHNKYLFVYPWVRGQCLSIEELSITNVQKIVLYLQKIHEHQPKIIISKNKIGSYWPNYERLLNLFNIMNPYILAMESLIIYLEKNQTQLQPILKEDVCLSHRDLRCSNVLWANSKPYFIDWERAGWVNRYVDLADTALNWSIGKDYRVHKDYFNLFLKLRVNLDQKILCSLVVSQWLEWIEDCLVNNLYAQAIRSLKVILLLHKQKLILP